MYLVKQLPIMESKEDLRKKNTTKIDTNAEPADEEGPSDRGGKSLGPAEQGVRVKRTEVQGQDKRMKGISISVMK